MIRVFSSSMDAHGRATRFDHSREQVLRFGYGNLGKGFEPIEHLGVVQRALCDLGIDGRTPVDLDIGEGLYRLPEAVIVKRVEPLFQFILIVKSQHGLSVPKRFRTMQICTRIARSLRPAEGACL